MAGDHAGPLVRGRHRSAAGARDRAAIGDEAGLVCAVLGSVVEAPHAETIEAKNAVAGFVRAGFRGLCQSARAAR